MAVAARMVTVGLVQWEAAPPEAAVTVEVAVAVVGTVEEVEAPAGQRVASWVAGSLAASWVVVVVGVVL